MEIFQATILQRFQGRTLSYIKYLYDHPFNILILCIDLAIVIYLITKVYAIIKDTDAIQLVKGIALLVIATIISGILNLGILNYILRSIMSYGVIFVMIVFQPELRKTLGNIGNKGIARLLKLEDTDSLNKSAANDIIAACEYLSSKRKGALIILERKIRLGDYEKTGIKIDGHISKELLINIFEPNVPLHDGAVIIEGEKIKAASCILPLTKRSDLKSEFGTRHRAGIGISEVSDCLSIIVSEETGKISIAMDGKISTNLAVDQLQKFLQREIKKEIVD